MAYFRSAGRLVNIKHSLGAFREISRPAVQVAIHTNVSLCDKISKSSRKLSGDQQEYADFRLELEAQDMLKKAEEIGGEKIILIDEDGQECRGVTFFQAQSKLRKGRTEMKFLERRSVETGALESNETTMRVFAIRKILNRPPKSFRMSTKIEDSDLEIKCRPMIKPLEETGGVLVRLKVKKGFEPDHLKERLAKVLENILQKPVTIQNNGTATLHVRVKVAR